VNTEKGSWHNQEMGWRAEVVRMSETTARAMATHIASGGSWSAVVECRPDTDLKGLAYRIAFDPVAWAKERLTPVRRRLFDENFPGGGA